MSTFLIPVRLSGKDLFWFKHQDCSGALFYPEQVEGDYVVSRFKGEPSYAHVYDDGVIKRFGKQIGTVEDLEVFE